MVRTVIDANDIAHRGREQRKKIAMHFRFKMPSCEVQQQWRRGGAAIQNPPQRTQTTQRKTRPLRVSSWPVCWISISQIGKVAPASCRPNARKPVESRRDAGATGFSQASSRAILKLISGGFCHSDAERGSKPDYGTRACHSDAERRRNLRHPVQWEGISSTSWQVCAGAVLLSWASECWTCSDTARSRGEKIPPPRSASEWQNGGGPQV